MKISLVSMRATPARDAMAAPAHGAPALRTPGAAAWASNPALPAPRAPVARPAAVSALSWELLAMHVEDAQRRSAIAYAPLRVVVQSVVRELRQAGESWEGVYTVLQSAVVPVPGRPVTWASEYEMHTSRSAALVAHMHSWADVQRLAELEGEEG